MQCEEHATYWWEKLSVKATQRLRGRGGLDLSGSVNGPASVSLIMNSWVS